MDEFDPLSDKSSANGIGDISQSFGSGKSADLINFGNNNQMPSGSYQSTKSQGPAMVNDLVSFADHSHFTREATSNMDQSSRPPVQGSPRRILSQDSISASVRPKRPPPPPPSGFQGKPRAGSENSLVNLDPKFVNLQLTSPSSTRSLKHETGSSFYTNLPQEPMDLPKATISRPINKQATSGSSFYVGPTDASSRGTITREPPALNKGASSFYDTSQPAATESMTEKLFGQREQVMQLCMAKRRDEYTDRQPFRIFAGTWNVNGQIPPVEVKDWLYFDRDPPDIYFIGFQELDLSKEAYVFSESTREDDWIKVVAKSLPTDIKTYKMLKRIRLVGMMLLVFVKAEHLRAIKEVHCHQVGTGILGRMGNKGGVSVRLELHNSTICVVNSHLAAHVEETQRRNEDFSTICTKLQFPVDTQLPMTVHQHDFVFWLGDLNYRIQDLASDFVKERIKERDFKLLREKDQLMMQKQDGNVFQGFSEGEIKFEPTYKYNPGTSEWDTSEKCRTPAWCDRVLWWEWALTQRNHAREKPDSSVELLKYRSHMGLMISDHKPVSALFNIKVKVIDEVRYKKVFEEENRRLDKLENEYLPTMTLNNQQIDFGEVKFQQPKQAIVELENTGMIPCNFDFICRPGEETSCKKWLTITKPKGCLLPGEKFVLEFEIYVNRVTAPLLNSGEETLEDILILHLTGGKDFFITVSGKYLPSCFGSSIEALCRLRRPIRFSDAAEIKKLSKIQPNRIADLEWEEDGPTLLIPKELWTLVDHLYKYARKQEDLFQQPGLHSELEEIRDCLDSKVDTTRGRLKLPGSNHSTAEALLVLLEAFPDPVIPFHLYQPCLESADIFFLCRQVLQGMTHHHRNVFKYIMAFLRELLKHSEDNGLDVPLLASIFSGLMLRPSPRNRKARLEARIEREKATKFITHFLTNEYDE